MAHNTKTNALNPRNVLGFLFQEERRSGVLLLVAAGVALVLANSSWSASYAGLLGRPLTFGAVTLDSKDWINNGLMAVFFLVVGLEIKRELVDGELRTARHALFPLIAALGGMLVPALIFSALNPYRPQNSGWAVPMATDIAIAVSVLALLGRRVPRSLRVFLLSLAIIDDIGSILVIGVFYSQPANTFALLVAVLLGLSLVVVRRWRYWLPWVLLIGLVVCYCLLLAGVSGTMAGVVVAMAVPLAGRRRQGARLQTSEVLEDVLLPISSYVVVPVFVLANAGLRFADVSLTSIDSFSVFVGVALGLLVGKPVGIVAAGWLAHSLRIAHKPRGASWLQIAGIGCLGGIGFTVALLVSSLAYEGNTVLQNAAIFGIFTASVVTGTIGLVILRYSSRRSAA